MHARPDRLWTGGVIGPQLFKNENGQAATVIGVPYRVTVTDFFWPGIEDMDLDDMWFQPDGATCRTANEWCNGRHDYVI
ncbi:unnamed protein product [Callosobruchus maculatus]|uniref:Uncharacterized protein n=1 Tax=Callosobruchus maculatus TaxID=64391 RepID=A0A653BPU3_CALMS|nr:unnamed protein product [Callosobruchus maculatus]